MTIMPTKGFSKSAVVTEEQSDKPWTFPIVVYQKNACKVKKKAFEKVVREFK